MNRNNDLLRRTVLAAFQGIVDRANLDGFDGLAEELNAAFKEHDDRIAELETRIADLEVQDPISRIEQLEKAQPLVKA